MSARFRITVPAPLPGTDSARSALPPAPLTWWRRLPPDAFNLAAQRPLRAALLASPPLPLDGWAQACDADPAAAARAALTALSQRDIDPDRHDAALSAVTLCAALGDPACATILAHALDRQARVDADLTALRLARAWRRQAGMACHLSGR